MKNPRIMIAIVGLSVAAVGGGVAIAATGGSSSTPSAGAAAPTSIPPSVTAATGTAQKPSATATLHTATATVGGATESILVNSKGLPLYTYQADTATSSKVTGELAALWPPLVANNSTASGATGAVSMVVTTNGRQVTYNGHFLYTFAEDSPGQVTGQGVQNFFVATPGIVANRGATTSTKSAPAPAPTTNRYGY
jgi:predicted lipoprotein with Yx(FWY)xxD motif